MVLGVDKGGVDSCLHKSIRNLSLSCLHRKPGPSQTPTPMTKLPISQACAQAKELSPLVSHRDTALETAPDPPPLSLPQVAGITQSDRTGVPREQVKQ